ncbi:MAG: hypothetical protein KDB27_15380 [Planctomycetales bacterium]|nr:hypothetical protein [Planctomycetales bacterium]
MYTIRPLLAEIINMPVIQPPNAETIRQLRSQLSRFSPRQQTLQASRSVLDQLLPGGGVRLGGIVEFWGDTGDGATTLSLWMIRQLCRNGGKLAIVDCQRQLFPPAIAALGIDLQHTVFVHPQSKRDEIWALVQCLRCPSVAAVWSCLGKLDAREYRCLQLAAEEGEGVGVFARPTGIRGQPTWADVQFMVTPQTANEFVVSASRRFVVEVMTCQQGTSGKSVTIDMDAITGEVRPYDAKTNPVCLVPQLANPPIGRSATGV